MKASSILIILLAIVVCLLMFNRFEGCDGKIIAGDTVVKIDTFYLQAKTDTVYKPSPVKYIDTGSIEYVKIPIPPQPTDTAAIIADYLSTYIYADSIPIKYGYAKIRDTLTANRIKGRSINIYQDIPLVEKTKTVTKRVSFGGQIGTGVLYNGRFHFGAYGGVGVTIKLGKK